MLLCLFFPYRLIGYFNQALESDWLFCCNAALISWEKCDLDQKKLHDLWINHTAESQSDCKDTSGFKMYVVRLKIHYYWKEQVHLWGASEL